MKIAILGWGSLIWQPKNLNFDQVAGWSNNGPILPIEFARISINGRLTLVITPSGTEVQTLYSVSSFDNIRDAVANLHEREGSSNIGVYDKNVDEFKPDNFQFKQKIKDWIVTTDFDAVIWTNLPENWAGKMATDRIQYLMCLDKSTKALAKEYIINTPQQIETEFRKDLREKLKWE